MFSRISKCITDLQNQYTSIDTNRTLECAVWLHRNIYVKKQRETDQCVISKFTFVTQNMLIKM